MERLTDTSLTKACNDPWDYCGLDYSCKKDCYKPEPCRIPKLIHRLAEIEDILGDDYDLDRLKELVEKDRNSAFAPYSKFSEKGQEVWYWDSENGISRGIIDFVNIDFYDNSLNEFGVDFPDENDFDVFNGSVWGTCIVASKEAALERLKGDK